MRLLNLTLVLALALAGCGGSDAERAADVEIYSAVDVRDALRAHGLDVELLSREDQSGTTFELLKLFSGDRLEGVLDVVGEPFKPAPANEGPEPWESTIEAWIFDSERTADRNSGSCGKPDEFTTCLHANNVVIIAGDKRLRAARAALDDLG